MTIDYIMVSAISFKCIVYASSCPYLFPHSGFPKIVLRY